MNAIPSPRGGLSLVGHVALLCAAVALPLLMLSAYLLNQAGVAERTRLEQQATDRVGDLARLIERDVDGMVAMVQALSTDPSLQSGDLAAFHRHATKMRALQGTNIVLRDLSGQQLVNTRLPWGSPLPRGADISQSDRAAIATGRPQVTDLFTGAVTGSPLFMVEVPVELGGKPSYLLGISLPATRIGDLLARSPLPEGWWYTVIDGSGRIVARTLDPGNSVGTLARPQALEAIAEAAPSASVVMRSPEGIDNFAAFHRIQGAGWTAAVAVPQQVLLKPLHRWLWGLGLLGLVTAAVSALAATWYGGAISRAVRRLTTAAEALGRGEAVPSTITNVADVNQAGLALKAAEAELAERAHQRDLSLSQATEARQAAEAASTAKSNFLAAISHDLRQPFQALNLFHQVLEMQAGPELGPVVDNMAKALHSGEELLAALAEVSVIEAGRVQPVLAEVGIDELLADIVEECAPLADKRGLALRRVPTCARVRSDRVLLRRILRNLVVNAIRYTERGGIVLGCRHRPGAVRIQVADTGIGIPADQLDRIFEDFYQIGNPARDRAQGLGLGLSIVSRLAALMGYPVSVRSAAGSGSVFTVEVPTTPAPDVSWPGTAPPPPAGR
ncbi:MAG: sensor histidine kinase [Actinomycetota bacterium]